MSAADALMGRRKLLIGLALAGTVGLSELYVPRRSAARLTDKSFEALFPTTVGGWHYLTASGLILPPTDQLSRTLYEQLLTRIYGNPASNDAVMMVLAYSSIQEGRLQVHRPEVCYPASGFSIAKDVETAVPIAPGFSIPCRFLIAERGARRECVLYWTRVGSSIPRRWFDQRLMMARDNLRGLIPDGLLARVSIVEADEMQALATLSGFVRELVGSVGREGRSLLIGPH